MSTNKKLTIEGDVWGDCSQVVFYMVGLSILRFLLAGIVNTTLKRTPCLFQLFSEGLGLQERRKFHENLWYTFWHISSFSLGVVHLLRQDWVADLFVKYDVFVVARGYPQSAIEMGFQDFYLLQLGFWISCCLFIFFETRRKDFVEMSVHHCSTVFLISFSYLFDFSRPGILVMSLHDLGDVFLYAAKSAQYRGKRALADLLFGLFAISFYLARLVFLPCALVYPLASSIWQGNSSPAMRVIINYGQGMTLTWMVAGLGLLVCLHCMWGTTIARMVVRTVYAADKKTVTENGDPRSGAEDSD